MPVPFDQDRFLAGLSAQRSRPVEVLPVKAGTDVPCGLMVSTDAADYIFVPANTTALHRQHIVFHEVAHLLCRHIGTPTLPVAALPGLAKGLGVGESGHRGYTDLHEREAELVATFLTQRATHLPGPGYVAELQGLDEAFGEGRR